ncbi:hypothetical protein A2U01_0054814, partial [Trifolium medium]|nr:hypothetical protein [Trifolium medium]
SAGETSSTPAPAALTPAAAAAASITLEIGSDQM